VLLAFACARRLAGTLAGVLAAAALVLTGGFVRHGAVGDAEPLLIALALGAVLLAFEDRHRAALALGVLCALLRPEVWPFLGVYALWRWREDPAARAVLAVGAGGVLALWFVPEWLGSGELLRSGERARASRTPVSRRPPRVQRSRRSARGAGIVLVPLAVLAALARGRAALLGAAGAAWIVLVALMSEAGFSGEGRYLLPGAALLAVAGAAGAARLPVPAVAVALIVAGAAAVPRADALAGLPARLEHQAALAGDLERAVARAGGRATLLACGRPAVGRYRGTLLAWRLDVPKRAVRADGRPGAVTFRSRLTADASPSPPIAPRPSRPRADGDVGRRGVTGVRQPRQRYSASRTAFSRGSSLR
jgi:hypothetical protein